MTTSAQPDFHSESKLVLIPAWAVVEMYSKQRDFADPSGWLGLGSGDLFDLSIPPYQRGLKWDVEKLKDFHDSLIQGWPVGTMAIAIEKSRTINSQSGQRKYSLSLIDGQQRSWALTSIIEGFWSTPWFSFENPKWELLQPAAGPIVQAKEAIENLALVFSKSVVELEETVRDLSKEHRQSVFEDGTELLERLNAALKTAVKDAKQTRKMAQQLCTALTDQYEEVREIRIPVLLLNEAMHVQLPTIFRRLNAGVPLKGYDLLAATWESRRLAPKGTGLTQQQTGFLQKVLEVADKRIQDSYPKKSEGYVLDPNVDPLQIGELSLFDLLYYLSAKMGEHPCFLFSSDVLAFQVSALLFNGSISRVDNALLRRFPADTSGGPDITNVPRLLTAAAQHIDSALKPMMDVSSTNLSLKGKVGLTPAVVYLSTFLTHHTQIAEDQGALVLRSRGQGASERMVAPGWFLTAQERLKTLKETLPAWLVHDALTSVFAGSRAYEAVNERVWAEFAGGKSPGAGNFALKPSNRMFEFPSLDDMARAFNRLWHMETSATKTPQRRRVSDGGAVLLRAAYSHLKVHDHVIDHVIPIGKGKASALEAGKVYPMNHVANLMPVPADINGKRSDAPWDEYFAKLSAAEAASVAGVLLIPAQSTSTSRLSTIKGFEDFLAQRYKGVVSQAMENLAHPDWNLLTKIQRYAFLGRVIN